MFNKVNTSPASFGGNSQTLTINQGSFNLTFSNLSKIDAFNFCIRTDSAYGSYLDSANIVLPNQITGTTKGSITVMTAYELNVPYREVTLTDIICGTNGAGGKEAYGYIETDLDLILGFKSFTHFHEQYVAGGFVGFSFAKNWLLWRASSESSAGIKNGTKFTATLIGL